MDSLFAITPIDGRYREKLSSLNNLVSEGGLIHNRLLIESKWLLHLSRNESIKKDLQLTPEITEYLENFASEIDTDMLKRVKEIEKTTNHDVKACEYLIKECLVKKGASPKNLAFIHFACTSEDINNLSYALMLKNLREFVLLPQLEELIGGVDEIVDKYKGLPMLSRTHGQTASPSTLGKEFAVFSYRIQRQIDLLKELPLYGKINGAVGNYNAHTFTYPNVDWEDLAKTFLEKKLGLYQNPLTTQIENHDSMIEFFDIVRRIDVILLGFCRDIWSYISIGYFTQKTKKGEIGSSTMPHKVNPIDFENSEGNLGVSISLCQHFAEKLPISRWQRDLSDSTVQRTIGTLIAHSVLAYHSFYKGIGKLKVNEDQIGKDLDSAYEVLAEPIQTYLRKKGVVDAYERLKEFTRGKEITKKSIEDFINSCSELSSEEKSSFIKMTPSNYTGIANQLAANYLAKKGKG